jgi:hypothetical protein
MTLRLELASLLAGFDVEMVRRERDEAIALLDEYRSLSVPVKIANYEQRIRIDLTRANEFLDTLPIGAVDAARARLAKR